MDQREVLRRQMKVARNYRISGRVQGVGYRYFALENAIRLGLRGYVRNLAGGDVEAVAEGEEALLAQFRIDLERGPGFARVDVVIEEETSLTEQYSSFYIRG